MSAPATVMLVDDHDLFRAGLRTLLEGEGVTVLGDTRLGDALAAVEQAQPTVILVDIQGDDESAFDLIGELGEAVEGVAIGVLTRSDSERDIYRSIRMGARGYLFKELPIPELAAAIKELAAGNALLAPRATGIVLRFMRTGQVPRIDDTEMSDREIDVLRLMARGMDNNQIADDLNISAKTVKNHVSSIFAKLGLTNRVQAAVYAVRSGIA